MSKFSDFDDDPGRGNHFGGSVVNVFVGGAILFAVAGLGAVFATGRGVVVVVVAVADVFLVVAEVTDWVRQLYLVLRC